MIDLKKYEAMAKLELSDTERQWAADRAQELLDGFSALEKINTEGAEPLVTVLEIQNVLRNDVAKKKITREELLSGAPEQYDGYFQAPKTLE